MIPPSSPCFAAASAASANSVALFLLVSPASYILQEVIGEGSFGIVRKCKQKKTGRLFACKSILKSQIPDLQVLKREIESLQMIRHPFIIRLEDVYEDSQHAYLVTEVCTGGELYDKVVALARTPQKHFDEATAARIIFNILSALSYLHEVKHIVHRDLKASNFLFVSPKHPTHIKIIDFGLSRVHEKQDVMRSRVGTPYYVAPEVLTSDYTNKCDVWSIGVIAYLLLSGTLPFLAADERQTLQLVAKAEVAFDKKKWQGISEQAKAFVSYLLQKDPEQRPTAREAMKHKWIVSYCGQPAPSSTDDCDDEAGPIQSLGASMSSSKNAPFFTMNGFLRFFGRAKSLPAVVAQEMK